MAHCLSKYLELFETVIFVYLFTEVDWNFVDLAGRK